MAFASLGSLGTASNNSTSGTTLVITTSAAAEAGNLVVLIIGKDNVQTTDGQTSEVTSVTDSATGNTWTKYGEFCNGQGAANAGAVVSVWACIVTNTIASSGTITATMSSAITAKAMTAWEYSMGAGNTIALAGTLQTLANDGADPGSMSISGLDSAEYLFIRGIGSEQFKINLTVTLNFTKFTDAAPSTGSEPASISAQGEFRILTGTSSTSDPTQSAADHASVFFALQEVAAADLSTKAYQWSNFVKILGG